MLKKEISRLFVAVIITCIVCLPAFASVEGTAAYTQNGGTVSKTGQTITAASTNESGVMVSNSGTLTLTNSTVTTSGSTTSEDDSNFYGLNAGVLSRSGSTINLTDCTITTSGEGANAVFSTGSGSSAVLTDVTINTSGNSARGIDATMTGSITATNPTITTRGMHCAAVATDRGEGAITVNGGKMTTTGQDSPGIYSTGTITVNNATLTATGSEAAVIEGKNSITLTNTNISGAKKRGVMLYQSTSGDAAVGTSVFTMTGGTLTAAVGPMFYATNTACVISLKNAILDGSSGVLLSAASDQWGTSGSNGADVTFIADGEILEGALDCSNLSTIDATMKNSTTLTGAVNQANTAKEINLSLDSSSSWTVTGTSYLDAFSDADTDLSNITSNGYIVYYDAGNSANNWLGSRTYELTGGGYLAPTGTIVSVVPVTGVSLNASNISLEAGSGTTLTATVVPTNATNKNVTWSSSDTSVATVDSNGYVTGVAEGSATITVVTVSGSYKAACTVEVSKSEETGEAYISIIRNDTGETIEDGSSLTLETKEKLMFTTSVYDENGNVVKKPKLKYTSSAKKICTVAKGKLTTKKLAGTSVITIYDRTTNASISFNVIVE